MNHKKKIKLFIFFILFLIISPIIVFYARGDIFSNNWGLIKTGGLYVSAAPIGSEIYLNNNFKDKVSFFQRDVLIKNLKPGMYEVEVKKLGYNTWSKKIKVYDNLVSDADVFTLPKNTEVREIPKPISKIASNTKSVLNEIESLEYADVLALFNMTTTKVSKIASTTKIDFKGNLGTAKSPIMNNKLGLWKEKNKLFVKWFGKNEAAPKYLCDETADCTKIKLVFELSKEPTKINYLPRYDGVVLVALDDLIFAVQIEDNPDKIIQILYKGISPDFRLNNNNLYVRDNNVISEIIL